MFGLSFLDVFFSISVVCCCQSLWSLLVEMVLLVFTNVLPCWSLFQSGLLSSLLNCSKNGEYFQGMCCDSLLQTGWPHAKVF